MLMSDEPQGQSFSNLPRSKKTAVILLSVTALAVLVTWFWQFNSRVYKPFNPSPDEKALADARKDSEATVNGVRDTDNDGLSDFDESNIYGTSAFIEDTDGDGILDGREVSMGTDPLCPEGQDCGAGSATTVATSTLAMNLPEGEQTTSTIDQELLIKALSGTGDPASLRELLRQGGADEETINSISDEDLMASYIEVLKSQNPAAVEVVNSATTSTISQ